VTAAVPNDRLLMVMPYKQLARKAREEGFRVFSIWDRALAAGDTLEEVARHSEELLLTDFGDVDGLRRLVTETAIRLDVAHVLHLGNEDTQLPVCEEAYVLGVTPNPPQALHQINDKAATRRLLRECGLSPVRTVVVGSPAEARARFAELDLPVVAKPTCLGGSRGVRLIREEHDLDDWERRLAAHGYDGPAVLEEFLRGPEYSVETLTVEGQHRLVGITAKRVSPLPDFVETGHLFPAPLAQADRIAMTDLVTTFLDAAGYRFGPAHTEVILTTAGPRVVESQTRIGGDRIPTAVRLASGFDVEAAIFRALSGKPVEIPEAHGYGCVSFFRLRPGRLESVGGLEEIRALPYVHELKFPFVPGATVPATVDSRSRHGYVVVDAGSEEEAEARVATVNGLLHTVVAS
jgi:biotin carboxylase